MSDFNQIIKKQIHKTIINELINKIYNYKIQGIDYESIDYFYVDKKIFMAKTISSFDINIKIIIIEINFLKTKPAVLENNFFTYCVECGEIHAQHKYRNCGHHVNYLCAYNKIKSNKCKLCSKNIIKQEVKLIKTDETDTCSICLDECNTVLPSCKHHFHKSCIKNYYKVSSQEKQCPMCRKDIFSLSNYTNKYENLTFSLPENRSGLVDIVIQAV